MRWLSVCFTLSRRGNSSTTTSIKDGPPQPQQQQPGYPQPQFPYTGQFPTVPRTEQSYIENIIRLNRGKVGTFHTTYPDSNEWRDRVYTGVMEAAGVDHIIISDPRDGKRYILLNIYLTWVSFNEEINYEYPIG
ncbi:TPA: spore coat protein GerQ [bacterium]|nr:spore coat protein GerQ [bacterium]